RNTASGCSSRRAPSRARKSRRRSPRPAASSEPRRRTQRTPVRQPRCDRAPMEGFLAALVNSLEIGLLLFVIAVGLNIIFGVLNVINFAHGGLYMLGAYLTFTLVVRSGLSFWP